MIFLILSRGLPWRAYRPHTILLVTSIGAIVAGVVLALGPWRHLFGFTGLPVMLLATLAGIAVAYLVAAETAKRFALTTSFTRK